jgi:hypothetical protein
VEISQHNLIDLFGAVSGIRRIMLIGFGVGLGCVFITIVRLALAEFGRAKSWSPTSTRRSRRARDYQPPPVIPPPPIAAAAGPVTLRTRIAAPRE